MASNGNSNIKDNNLMYQQPIDKRKMKAGDTSRKKELRIDDRTVIFVPLGLSEKEMELKKAIYLSNMTKFK